MQRYQDINVSYKLQGRYGDVMKWPHPTHAAFPQKTMFSDKAPQKSCLSRQHFHSRSPDCSPAAMKRVCGKKTTSFFSETGMVCCIMASLDYSQPSIKMYS